VTTTAVRWGTDTVNDPIVIAGGEIRPRVGPPAVWQVRLLKSEEHFGFVDFAAIFIYLSAMIGVGVFFSFRNKNTNDFFRGGQRVPWFVAGLSIFATMLSSITFIAIPAKAYATLLHGQHDGDCHHARDRSDVSPVLSENRRDQRLRIPRETIQSSCPPLCQRILRPLPDRPDGHRHVPPRTRSGRHNSDDRAAVHPAHGCAEHRLLHDGWTRSCGVDRHHFSALS
jgi:hypothetical protein